ncbi:unnamed protein product [Bursaphelenchus okinawaensis]|uniref:Uncharacterized protein n=1 Tax=Bursaphelenchus okinawaensis TaxID=465554 RepID=A0A811LQF6_9BILA|nr:unnamed protein product [Bursaphelenchus okinawaensis]CAG9125750.1 unnamed protein product [Bursaphelenchus okinawaensis]
MDQSIKKKKKGSYVKLESSLKSFKKRKPKKNQTAVTAATPPKKDADPSNASNRSYRRRRKRIEVTTEFTQDALTAFKKFVADYSAQGINGLRRQYADIKLTQPKDTRQQAFDANFEKCRYRDIPCWDKNRIVLKWPTGITEDFIHANRVKCQNLDIDVICTQAPRDNTIGDFWRMVWQEKIFMLCQENEGGKPKCSHYYPTAIGQEMVHFGLTIICKKIETDPDFVITELSISDYEGNKMTVMHRQWTTWPDREVPKSPMNPFKLLQHIRKPTFSPIIHCSAGVGRTGTLIAIEIIYRTLNKGNVPDVKAIVLDVRNQRSHAVQTETQYLYLVYSIFQFCASKHIVPSETIAEYCSEYHKFVKLVAQMEAQQPGVAVVLPIPAFAPTPVPSTPAQGTPSPVQPPPAQNALTPVQGTPVSPSPAAPSPIGTPPPPSPNAACPTTQPESEAPNQGNNEFSRDN